MNVIQNQNMEFSTLKPGNVTMHRYKVVNVPFYFIRNYIYKFIVDAATVTIYFFLIFKVHLFIKFKSSFKK